MSATSSSLLKLVNEPKAIGEVFNIGNTEEITIRGWPSGEGADRQRRRRSSSSRTTRPTRRVRGHAAARAGPHEDPRNSSATSRKCSSNDIIARVIEYFRSRSAVLVLYWRVRCPNRHEKGLSSFSALFLLALPASPCLGGRPHAVDPDGRVSLDAQNVTIRQILAEWARVGKTRS